jgi:hypothetical protein
LLVECVEVLYIHATECYSRPTRNKSVAVRDSAG